MKGTGREGGCGFHNFIMVKHPALANNKMKLLYR
jgi:hypothetical protein